MSQKLLKNQIADAKALLSWIGKPRQSPKLMNKIYESDAEILRLSDTSYLAISVDQLSEEISHGLYRYPNTIGRIAIESALSDLAAVGASPLGVVVGSQWCDKHDPDFRRSVFAAMEKTLRSHQTFLLGGDTSSAAETSFSVTALGESSTQPLQRKGAREGDIVVMTGTVGTGPALGFHFFERTKLYDERKFLPRARLKEGAILKRFASSCMDTSDGFAATLATLEAVNDVGFSIYENQISYSPIAKKFTQMADLPRTSLLFGEVGDFELIATVPPNRIKALTRALPNIQSIGLTVKKPAMSSVILGKNQGEKSRGRIVPVPWALNQRKQKDTIKSLHKAYEEMLDTLRSLQLP